MAVGLVVGGAVVGGEAAPQFFRGLPVQQDSPGFSTQQLVSRGWKRAL
jgi:hypothetical protein